MLALVVVHLELALAFLWAEPASPDVPVDPEGSRVAIAAHQHLLVDHGVHRLGLHGIVSRLETLGKPVLQVLCRQRAQKFG